MACAWVQQNYILAFLEKPQINEAVTLAIIGTIIGAFVTLCVKSLGEKMNANKNGIDAKTGKPFMHEIQKTADKTEPDEIRETADKMKDGYPEDNLEL